jgi:metal-responsive CopG/Arc/MetJ family transcriptional regulator
MTDKKQVNVKLNEELTKEVEKVAKAFGTSNAQAIRQIIKDRDDPFK